MPGAAEVDEGVHGGPDGAARVQDVVHQHDRAPVDVERDLGALDDGLLGDHREVVAVERDVQRPDRDLDALVLGDRLGDPAGQRHASALDPDQHQPGRAGLLLDDLVGDARDRAADVLGGHDPAPGHGDHLRRRTGLAPPSRPHGATRPHGTGTEIGAIYRDRAVGAADHRRAISRPRRSPRSCRRTIAAADREESGR